MKQARWGSSVIDRLTPAEAWRQISAALDGVSHEPASQIVQECCAAVAGNETVGRGLLTELLRCGKWSATGYASPDMQVMKNSPASLAPHVARHRVRHSGGAPARTGICRYARKLHVNGDARSPNTNARAIPGLLRAVGQGGGFGHLPASSHENRWVPLGAYPCGALSRVIRLAPEFFDGSTTTFVRCEI